MCRGQVKYLVVLGLLFAGQAATAESFSECLALRDLGTQLVSKARSAEAKLVNEQCPKENFRKRLNNVYEWAWETDVKARQMCREAWREQNEYEYIDIFVNGYRSEEGVEIAKSIEELGVKMESISCPTGDLKWTK